MRTTRKRECVRCLTLFDTPHGGPWPARFCSQDCYSRPREVKPPKPRPSMPRTTGKANRKPVAVASKEQAAKRNAGASIVSGETYGLDAAHLTPRPLGGCSDADCTIPLTRAEHAAFDRGELDLLPYLVAHKMHLEIAHALEHYRCDLPALLERLTGCKWVPVEADDVRRAA